MSSTRSRRLRDDVAYHADDRLHMALDVDAPDHREIESANPELSKKDRSDSTLVRPNHACCRDRRHAGRPEFDHQHRF
jgi:hypothetical protein